MSHSTGQRCPLCNSNDHQFYFKDKFRVYYSCLNCFLVFVPRRFHVSEVRERERYLEHNNDPSDDGYRNFLARIMGPLRVRFAKGAKGLDFGCGPVTVLAEMLEDSGFEMEVYDPIFHERPEALKGEYDFVVSTEVLEHLSKPHSELDRLFSLLGHGGVLALMTRPLEEDVDFKTWHYKNDPTHICFYSEPVFEWISAEFNVGFTREGHDIFVFEKSK